MTDLGLAFSALTLNPYNTRATPKSPGLPLTIYLLFRFIRNMITWVDRDIERKTRNYGDPELSILK